MKKRVIILGSTGSIGRSALDVLSRLGDEFEVVGLAAGSRVALLAEQANRHRPQAVALARADGRSALQDVLAYTPRVFCGEDALTAVVEEVPCECVLSSVVGAIGLSATLRAAELGRRIALANKEALVIAGPLLTRAAEINDAAIIPVDSEHSAIFQAMHAGRPDEVRRVYLTASGGPFRNLSSGEMKNATPADALCHPTWNMGPKTTIDSATMMNKALEIVEARWLFNLHAEQIEVVVHAESIIHSFVEFCDGSVVAQLGTPDMRTPIQYALTYPSRRPCPSKRLELTQLRQLTLEAPDRERFPALDLGYAAAQRAGTCGAVLNAANETAVQLFRDGALRFTDITRYVEIALNQHDYVASPTLEELIAADRWARREVIRCTTC